MRRRHALFAGPCLCWGGVHAAPKAPRVVFLNPGEPVERGKGPHWRMTAHFMAAAARSFGIQLEVLYAERNHLLMLQQADEVARRATAPDYVVMVNEKLAGPQMLKAFAPTPAKVLMIHNGLTPEQRQEVGNERERLPQWIGTVTTDEVRAEYRLMEELVHQLGGREPQVLGITGDRATPVSLERTQGVSDFIARSGRGRVLQTAFSDWGSADAEDKAAVLLSRHPGANVIWAANDSMALGALRAVRAARDRPVPVLVGGTGAWPDALDSIGEGGLAASVGSHFFIGAWAMVLLHDYHHGRDFAEHGGLAQKLDYMRVVNRDNAPQYDRAVYRRGDAGFDFRVYSKWLNPAPGPYRFDLAPLLRERP
jgi:ABC-type sugar transport system substrate-binding protein